MRRLPLLLLLASCASAPQISTKDLQPGQVWSYQTREGEEDSRITILRIDADKDFGSIVHVAVRNLRAPVPTLPHVPMAGEALAKSLVKQIGNSLVPDISQTYAEWQANRTASKPCVFTQPLADVIGYAERSFRALEAKLPAYLPDTTSKPAPKVDRWVDYKVFKDPKLRWELDGKRHDNMVSLQTGMTALNGKNVGLRIVVGDSRVTYGEVAPMVDLAVEHGIKEIVFAGGLHTKR